MNITKRITKFLLIAALAIPAWNAASAQKPTAPPENVAAGFKSFTTETSVSIPVERKVNEVRPDAMSVGSCISKVKAGNRVGLPVKLAGKPMKTSVKRSNAKGNVATKADIPDGYVEIVFHVENVWNDGSGYQLLIGSESSLTSATTWSNLYSAAVYSVPENADYSSTGNATNMIVEGTQSIMIPAGTYDYVVTNPTPGDKTYRSTYDTYTFNAGGSYEFHIYSNNGSETLDINVTEPASDVVGVPTNLEASPDATTATISWVSGENNESWNLRYREVGDVYNKNRFWDFESESQIDDFTMLDIDGDGYNWGRNGGSASLKVQSGSYIMQSASYLNNIGALTPNNWLITPKVKLGGSVSFYACGQDNSDYSEKFGVYVFQGGTWTSVNDFAQVGNDRTTGSSMTKYTFDLSSYSGPGYIAIVHHNTTDMFFLNIDDIEVLVPDALPDNEWIYVNDVTNPYTITGLTTGTTYEVQVQGVGNNTTTDWTASEIFTTLAPTQSLDFGSVNVNSNKTLNAKLMNESGSDVQATITVNPNPPFSVASTTVTLAANSLTSVPVTFTPTEARNFNGTLTVVAGGVTSIVTLTGVGDITGSPAAVRDSAFYAGITYNWTDSLGTTHTSNLTEIATDPDQMIAMIREVYTNQNIPGNYRRGYPSYSTNIQNVTEGFDKVYYSGVGKVNSSGEYEDAYGWGITGTVKTKSNYQYLDTIQYRPYNEGTTLLLVEVRDDFEETGSTTYVYDSSTNTTTYTTFYNDPYKNLRQILIRSIKSIRVITKAKRSGDGVEAGTLFKIDCNKMNKFYFMAKGQLNHTVNSLYGRGYWYCAPPCLYGSSFYDYFSHPLFYHMFEQFSPVSMSSEAPYADMYWDLVDMSSFNVEHDCMAVVPLMNHQFQMYGTNSSSDDCQDIRDLMFFVPDFRMLKWSGRETYTYRKFLNYNTAHAPKMGLFVIKQNTITGEQVSVEGAPTYKLHLTWASNLLDFMPDEDGMYTLYRVITDADGNKTYEVVCEFADPNTLDYYDYVPMQQNGQQVTYVVQGQDKGKFLDLQMSNEESFIIPGLDHAEQLRINLNSDYYFSRYDAAEQKNYYSNSLIANNTVGTNVKPNYIKNGSEFKFWRATLKTVDGATVVDTDNAVNFVTATVENYTETGGGRLRYGNWSDDQVNFSSKPYGHGYHSTPATSNITISSGEVVFDGLKLYDNFCVGVEENTHPAQYVYYLTLETAVPFSLDQDLPSCAVWFNDSIYAYFESPYNDWYEQRAYAWDGDDLFAGEWAGTLMNKVGTSGSKTIWRWSIPTRADGSLPAYIIFSYKDGMHQWRKTQDLAFVNGGYYTITDVGTGQEQVTGGYVATVSEDNNSNQARSNTVSVPVYKTAMTMVPITAADVEADMTHSKPAATQFTLNARYSSKDEILGYYIYRWADNDPEQPRTIYEDNGDDASPQGQAGNQAENYSVAMNTDYEAETEHFVMDANGRYPDVTATFVDNFMVNDAKDADTYTYAPVVELFAPHGAKVLNETTLNPTNEDRGDYNTYGGPQQMTAGGIVRVQVVKSAKSDYYWTANNKTYRYYNVYLYVDTLDLPGDYQIAKVRAWRKIAPQYLGEEEDKGYMSRLDLDANGEYVFVNKNACQKNDFLGDEVITNNVRKGTFGAVDVSTGETIPMKFVVRIYFTKNSSSKAGDQPYYIMETEIEDNLTDDIPVGINGVEVKRNVISVSYVNTVGQVSSTPWKGVNMVVTRYTDGSTSTTKVMK